MKKYESDAMSKGRVLSVPTFPEFPIRPQELRAPPSLLEVRNNPGLFAELPE